MNSIVSKNNVTIRLTEERWQHIISGHPEISDYLFQILNTIQIPDAIYEGNDKCLIAEKNFRELNNKFVIVVYKETSENDGFIITAFFSKKTVGLKNKLLWKQ